MGYQQHNSAQGHFGGCKRASVHQTEAGLLCLQWLPVNFVFFLFLAQAMLTKPPQGLQLSCEFVGHLQLSPVLEAAALPLWCPAAARREFNCKAPSAGSQGVKSKFTHTPWHPSARQSRRWGERSRRSQITADSLPGFCGMLDVDCSHELQIPVLSKGRCLSRLF